VERTTNLAILPLLIKSPCNLKSVRVGLNYAFEIWVGLERVVLDRTYLYDVNWLTFLMFSRQNSVYATESKLPIER